VKNRYPSLLLALVAVLALAGTGGAFAQADMGNSPTSGATFMVGVVQSITSDSVTLELASGEQQTILLGDHTVGKQFLVNGSRARIDYRTNDHGQAVAEVIQSSGDAITTVAEAPVVDTPVARVEVERTAPAPTSRYEPAPSAEVSVREPRIAPTETRSYSLPATASWMPGLALLGLLATAGAVAIRIGR
jgi:hypothetical protein